MAKVRTIYQRIALDGGNKLQSELTKIGKDGQAAFVKIGKAADDASRKMAAVGTAARNFGSALSTVGTRLALFSAALAGVGAGVFAFARAGASMADEARKQAQALGLTTDAYGRLIFAAEQSGVGLEQVRSAFGRMNQQIGQAAQGNETAIKTFQDLGVSISGANGQLRPTEDILKDIADRFAAMPDGAAKSALAIQLMGESGARLVPLLNAGSQGITALGSQAEQLGIVFTDSQGKVAEAMNDSLAALGKAVAGTKAQIGLLFAPGITEAAQAFTNVINRNRDALVDMIERGLLRATFVALEFIAAFTGNDHLVEDSWVISIRDAVLDFMDTVRAAYNTVLKPVFAAISAGADFVAEKINGMFGTDIDGKTILVSAALLKLLGVFSLVGAGFGLVASLFSALGAGIGVVVAAIPLLVPALSALVGWLGSLAAGAVAVVAGFVSWPVLIVAAIVAAGVAIFAFWDEIKAGAAALGPYLSERWDEIKVAFSDLWARLKEIPGETWEGIKGSARAAADHVVATWRGSVDLVKAAWGLLSAAGEGAADAASTAWDNAAVVIGQTWDKITAGASEAADFVAAAWNGASDLIETAWDGLVSFAGGIWDSLRDGFGSAADWVEDKWTKAAAAIRKAWDAVKSAGATVGGAAADAFGFASGGHVRGPGTETSDSIPAWLSRNEYVIRAKAVRHYGTEFFAALNAMRLPRGKLGFATGGHVTTTRSSVQNVSNLVTTFRNIRSQFATGGLVQMPKFSAGGLVHALAAGFPQPIYMANGGLVPAASGASGRPTTVLNLSIGGEMFEGLIAPEETADRLSRFAASRSVRSAGRRPGWSGV